MNEQLALDSPYDKTQVEGPVECLGMTFENDEKRREYFLEKLREKLQDPEFRKIEGFPIGSDEDIIAMSDPPYYTACPNPFIENFIAEYASTSNLSHKPRTEPFATDITEGKSDYYYNVHTYHTKVPYRAIARFILHYTLPGSVILDNFCGTGMTGLAVQACSNPNFVHELDPTIPTDRIGPRLTILTDLSPAATHIAYSYNARISSDEFIIECSAILKEFSEEYGWMFTTTDPDTGEPAPVDYFVWSDVFACPNCGYQIVFWDEGFDKETGHKNSEKNIACPSCRAISDRDKYERVIETYYDEVLERTEKKQKEEIISIVYSKKNQKKSKIPDKTDANVLARVASEPIVNVPILKMLNRDVPWGDMFRSGYHVGITHFHHFFYRRSLICFSWLWDRVNKAPSHLRTRLHWWLQSVAIGHTRLNRYFSSSYSQVNRYLKGFLYIAQVRSETSPWYTLRGKIARMAKSVPGKSPFAIGTASATQINLPDKCVDYIFTDPPFGGNIIYSELNFLWEAWFGVFTNQTSEAIISKTQGKGLESYQNLMKKAFGEYFRILKPGCWMTVEFHNAQNAVWTAIQRALESAGFVVADVRIFDKKQLTMKQQTTTGAVKKDLIISAYRPNDSLEGRFQLVAGSEEGAWRFVENHLRQLPVFVLQDGAVEAIAERQAFLLFDRMVAFHVQRGVTVSLSAAEFYQGLAQRFPERDGMYFLPEHAAEYDKKRMTVKEILQLEFFVIDEASAIQWLKQQLTKKPQTFQELHPQFLKEIGGWQKHEKPLELSELLQENFLCYDGKNDVPSQIHSYISTNFKELRSLSKDNHALRTKAKDRWYVPDPNKADDLEKLRERTLLREFWDYLPPGYKPAQPESQAGFIPGLEPKTASIPQGKQFRVIRMEAVRAGFAYCYRNRDYRTIIAVARRIPESILQEDQKLLMWYDQALTRSGEEA